MSAIETGFNNPMLLHGASLASGDGKTYCPQPTGENKPPHVNGEWANPLVTTGTIVARVVRVSPLHVVAHRATERHV